MHSNLISAYKKVFLFPHIVVLLNLNEVSYIVHLASLNSINDRNSLKFIYSEKATTFWINLNFFDITKWCHLWFTVVVDNLWCMKNAGTQWSISSIFNWKMSWQIDNEIVLIFVQDFKYETIDHWVPTFFIHNELSTAKYCRLGSNFVVFSEYMNFKQAWL